MNILKHGSLNRTKRLLRFKCKACGCEFIAGLHEVYRNMAGLEYACHCPDCFELCGEANDEQAAQT